jgi:uncharacterized membrane-anchored protein YjiN (DUF445 family)
VPSSPVLSEAQREQRLRRMKRIPLALLVLMAVLFVLTLDRPETWAAWVHAFSEAGMIGALADWFAVVALFRHPLGIPIPHTAIIPTRKNELGQSMARFVADHFLEPEVVRDKLSGVNLSMHMAVWLGTQRGRDNVTGLAVSLLRWGMGALHEKRVRDFIGRLSQQRFSGVQLAPMMGQTLDWLIRDGRHQQVLTQIIRHLIVVLHDNRDVIRERVQHKSPWWLPGFVDDRILKQMLERIETQLFEMSLDDAHPLRGQFNSWLMDLAEELKTSSEYRRLGERLKQQMLENGELHDYLYSLWTELVSSIEADLDQPESVIRDQMGAWLATFAVELENDDDMQMLVNGWLQDSGVALVKRNRHAISTLISDTVESWDGLDTSRRVELAIGHDLQFIRINGTLVGGLVGVLIHALTRL